jgi:hypothetical protein
MAALLKDRNTPMLLGDNRRGLAAAAATIFAGAILMRNAAGHVVNASTATGLVGVGRAEVHVDNSAGSAGDQPVDYKPGIFRYANSTGADEITIADIGKLAYAVDDQTVAKTDGATTRSPAGLIDDVDAQGVWVRFDEALTATAAA